MKPLVKCRKPFLLLPLTQLIRETFQGPIQNGKCQKFRSDCLSVGQLLRGWCQGQCVEGDGLLSSVKVTHLAFMFKCAKI